MNCHNGERYLNQALGSILTQSFEDFEVIFWDNASVDRSRNIALEYGPKIRLFSSDEKKTLGEVRNEAISKAKGKYICFLDCDDLFAPDRLKSQFNLMERSGAIFSYGNVKIIDARGKKIRTLIMKNCTGSFEKLLLNYEINMQTVMIRTSALNRSSCNFNKNYKYCPDYDLFLRLVADHGALVINQTLAYYRVHSNSLSSSMLDIVSKEIGGTLKSLVESRPELAIEYKREFDFAFSKLNYYDAIFLVSCAKYGHALTALRDIKCRSWKFFALYWLVRLSIPKVLILKLLRRG